MVIRWRRHLSRKRRRLAGRRDHQSVAPVFARCGGGGRAAFPMPLICCTAALLRLCSAVPCRPTARFRSCAPRWGPRQVWWGCSSRLFRSRSARSDVMDLDPKPVEPKADPMRQIAVGDDQIQLAARKRLGGRLDIPFAGIRDQDHPPRHAVQVAFARYILVDIDHVKGRINCMGATKA